MIQPCMFPVCLIIYVALHFDKNKFNLRFYFLTEEVMLAEENKNSGRSALDGECTHFRSVITHRTFITCHFAAVSKLYFIIKKKIRLSSF